MSIVKPVTYDLPYAINITLYKHNYYDRIIINRLKKDVKCLTVPNITDSFIVDINDFRKTITTRFNKELYAIQYLSDTEISKNASSIYFINRILGNFQNLKYIKINVSDKSNFTRLIGTESGKHLINFEYKILTCIIDFADYLESKEEFKAVNKIFKTISLIKEDPFSHGKSYITTTSQEFITLLDVYQQTLFNEDGTPRINSGDIETLTLVLDILYELVDKKIEQDNCKLIFITDYLN